jgi:MFS family permease
VSHINKHAQFYYGTTIFAATGLENSYVTSIILGTVNVAATIAGLWIVENVGRRKAMMVGAAWMGACLFIYSFVGHYQLDLDFPQSTPQAGNIMIVFTCLFIAGFATTWGPLVWAIVGELYPARYRATCMALATASNWCVYLFQTTRNIHTNPNPKVVQFSHLFLLAEDCEEHRLLLWPGLRWLLLCTVPCCLLLHDRDEEPQPGGDRHDVRASRESNHVEQVRCGVIAERWSYRHRSVAHGHWWQDLQ